jgi:TonB family protein
MTTLLNYLIEANLALLFFYVLYWLLLSNENQFTFKRAYLLGSLVASLLFPLITIPSGGTQLIPSLSQSAASYLLPEITIYAHATHVKADVQTSTWQWITYLYTTGLILFSVLFVIRVASLILLFMSSKKYHWKNFLVAESDKNHGSFSFFHFIFLGKTSELNEQEKQAVLIHEEVHAQKIHSLDIVLVNMLGVVFWFNPILHAYRNSLVQVHEFEADARSVEGRDVNAYCSLLARVALQSNGYPIANHFTNSLTLKRIRMMKTVRTKIKHWKIATASFAMLLIFFVVACQDQVDQDMRDVAKSSSLAMDLPAEVRTALDRLQAANPESKFEVIELNDEGKEYLNKKYPSENSKITFTTGSAVSVIKESGSQRQFIIIGEDEKLKRISRLSKNENDVFTVVDETAKPLMGMETFYRNISYSIIYPAEARKNKQEGKVFVEFIIETNGDISNVKIAKGVNEYLDAEAIRVFLQTQTKWTPAVNDGQVVKQKLVLPIVFILSDSNNSDSGHTSSPTLEEIVVVGQQPKKN